MITFVLKHRKISLEDAFRFYEQGLELLRSNYVLVLDFSILVMELVLKQTELEVVIHYRLKQILAR